MLTIVIPENHAEAEDIKTTFQAVVANHPLILKDKNSEGDTLSQLTVMLRLTNGHSSAQHCYSPFISRVCIEFDPRCYRADLEKVLMHEFTHFLDRINPSLDWSAEAEAEARAIALVGISPIVLNMFVTVWDCHIDGRLERNKKNPRTFDNRIQNLIDAVRRYGSFDDQIKTKLGEAWNNPLMSLAEITSLTRICVTYWHPNKKG